MSSTSQTLMPRNFDSHRALVQSSLNRSLDESLKPREACPILQKPTKLSQQDSSSMLPPELSLKELRHSKFNGQVRCKTPTNIQ